MLNKSLANKIQLWEIEKLVPYEKNARTHSSEQIKEIANSIDKFGFNNPILVDGQKGIIAGHGRLLAAKHLGMKEVPIVILDHLTEVQKRAYIIADNKIALNADWDPLILSEELKELKELDFDIKDIGFSTKELEEFLDNEVVEKEVSDKDIDLNEQYIISVSCRDEIQMEQLYSEFKGRGLECKLIT